MTTFREQVEGILRENHGEIPDLTTRRYLTVCARCGALWHQTRARDLKRCPACDGRCRRTPVAGGYLLGRGRRRTFMARDRAIGVPWHVFTIPHQERQPQRRPHDEH